MPSGGWDMSLKKPGRFWNRLTFRLTVWYAGIFTLSSLIAFVLFYALITSVIRERTDQELVNQAGKFSTVLQEQGIGAVENFAFLETQEAGVRKVFFRLLYPAGQTFSADAKTHRKPNRDGRRERGRLLAGSN